MVRYWRTDGLTRYRKMFVLVDLKEEFLHKLPSRGILKPYWRLAARYVPVRTMLVEKCGGVDLPHHGSCQWRARFEGRCTSRRGIMGEVFYRVSRTQVIAGLDKQFLGNCVRAMADGDSV